MTTILLDKKAGKLEMGSRVHPTSRQQYGISVQRFEDCSAKLLIRKEGRRAHRLLCSISLSDVQVSALAEFLEFGTAAGSEVFSKPESSKRR
jgi:hypothetical protein